MMRRIILGVFMAATGSVGASDAHMGTVPLVLTDTLSEKSREGDVASLREPRFGGCVFKGTLLLDPAGPPSRAGLIPMGAAGLPDGSWVIGVTRKLCQGAKEQVVAIKVPLRQGVVYPSGSRVVGSVIDLGP